MAKWKKQSSFGITQVLGDILKNMDKAILSELETMKKKALAYERLQKLKRMSDG